MNHRGTETQRKAYLPHPPTVIPAKAGIHIDTKMDPRFRGDDEVEKL